MPDEDSGRLGSLQMLDDVRERRQRETFNVIGTVWLVPAAESVIVIGNDPDGVRRRGKEEHATTANATNTRTNSHGETGRRPREARAKRSAKNAAIANSAKITNSRIGSGRPGAVGSSIPLSGPVVCSVSVEVGECVPSSVSDGGANMHVTPCGNVPQLSVTICVEPLMGVTVNTMLPDCPAVRLRAAGLAITEKSGVAAALTC